jgi:hypothetical protein
MRTKIERTRARDNLLAAATALDERVTCAMYPSRATLVELSPRTIDGLMRVAEWLRKKGQKLHDELTNETRSGHRASGAAAGEGRGAAECDSESAAMGVLSGMGERDAASGSVSARARRPRADAKATKRGALQAAEKGQ